MKDKFTVCFDHSNEDIPTLIVSKTSGFLEPTLEIINIFSGEKAEELYDTLTKKKHSDFLSEVLGNPKEASHD